MVLTKPVKLSKMIVNAISYPFIYRTIAKCTQAVEFLLEMQYMEAGFFHVYSHVYYGYNLYYVSS